MPNSARIFDRALHGKERLRITQDGQALAAVVPIEDWNCFEALEDRIDLEDARTALDEAKGRRHCDAGEFRTAWVDRLGTWLHRATRPGRPAQIARTCSAIQDRLRRGS